MTGDDSGLISNLLSEKFELNTANQYKMRNGYKYCGRSMSYDSPRLCLWHRVSLLNYRSFEEREIRRLHKLVDATFAQVKIKFDESNRLSFWGQYPR